MKKTLSIFTILALSLGCAPRVEDSALKQGFDNENKPDKNGYTDPLTYEALTSNFSANTDRTPWTDTYWPSVNQGLSYRWAKLSNVLSDIGLVDFLDTHLGESAKAQPSVYLAPAEKYDLIYRWRYNKTLNADTLAALRMTLAEKEAEVTAADDLLIKRSSIASMNKALQENSTILQSVLPLSRDGWATWTDRTSWTKNKYLNQDGTGDDWSWEGLCHGWAPAALFAEAPKHAVKVKLDDKEILMTEGDIRGLLTYAWANYSPRNDQYFIGRRCNLDVADDASRGPVDALGRNIYGNLQKTASDAKINFSLIEEITPKWLSTSWIYGVFNRQAYFRLYSIQLHDAQQKVSYLFELNYMDKDSGRWNKMSFHTDKLSQIQNFVESQSAPQPIALASVEINGCGDVNPAALHTTLVKALKNEKIGFVIDRTQSGQVWNQPVHAAQVFVKSTMSIEKAMEKYPNLVARIAPGTVQLAEVNVGLSWSYEPYSPRMDYTLDDDKTYATGSSKLEYILEFDAEGQLIGGEWGTFETTQPTSQVPDFIYGYKKDSKPFDDLAEGFDYSGIIGQIHSCSLKDQADGVEVVGSKNLSYVNCEISKAAL